ncbi:MAG: zf-HC2 domain-containing protein [Planctomycetota bacterium]|nr:zf-HC2 domain-containing protein [Planctomycetota bacterium]
MNCDPCRDNLMDYLYGELPEASRVEVQDHLAACEACRAELGQLQLARLAVGRLGDDGAGEFSQRCERILAKPTGRGVRLRRWLVSAGAAAAAIAMGIVLLTTQVQTPPASAAMGPVAIKRVGVSLTILSQPENWRGGWGGDVQMVRQQMDSPSQSSAINAKLGRGYMPGVWQGLAMVRDQRLIENLGKGRTTVRFAGVPAGILCDSVRLRGLDDPEGLTILEQNYQYDLANAGAILKRYLDKRVKVTLKDDKTASGRLLSVDEKTLVIQPDAEGPRNVDRSQVRTVTLEKLPEGLLTQPTLVWELENRAAARQQFEVAYLTQGLSWRADYVLKLKVAAGVNGPAGTRELPAVVDTGELVGYATVTNNSGVAYEQAELKLLAGDVNLVQPPEDVFWYGDGDERGWVQRGEKLGVFQEKSFFEYHLYTLGRPTSLANAETKQIELVSGSGIRMRRGYVYDPQGDNPTAVRVVSEFKNSKANGLGKPLPKGVVRLYAPDPEGADAYVSQVRIDHTPKDEKVRLAWGHAFDIAGTFTETDYNRRGDDQERTYTYQLRNHKDYDVTVTVIVRVEPSTYKAECNLPYHVREVGLVEVEVPVKANGDQTVTFTDRWNPYQGGGLKSTRDEEKETDDAKPQAEGVEQ